MFTPNEIVLCDNYAEIILYNQKNIEKGRAIIDIKDIEKVRGYKWYLSSIGYATYGNSSKTILLHRLLVNCNDEMQVDHINGNKLDNRRCNLRICTHQENHFNQGLQKNNRSGCSGVWFDKCRKKWCSYIMVNQKNIFLGRFYDKEEAIKTRRAAEEKYFGEYKYKGV